MNTENRYAGVFSWFEKNYGELTTELRYNSPFELLVAVMLSAQCTDERINKVTPKLFSVFPSVFDMARATEEKIYSSIRSVSYPRAKSRYLLKTAQMIVSQFNGEVPSDMNALLSLPGVGRKTANVVSSILWHKPTIGVDTHIFRICNRIGLCHNAKTPLSTEQQLLKNLPAQYISMAHHWLIHHGRYICQARKPLCIQCGIREYCNTYTKLIATND